jgi:hypothetical protein
MGFLILAKVKDESYHFFKRTGDSLSVFTDTETESLIKLFEANDDKFPNSGTLHRGNQEIRKVSFAEAEKNNAVLDMAPFKDFMKELSNMNVTVAGIESGEVLRQLNS